MIHTFEVPSHERSFPLKQSRKNLHNVIKSLYTKKHQSCSCMSKIPQHVLHIVGLKCDSKVDVTLTNNISPPAQQQTYDTSHHIDPTPELSYQEEIIARHLAMIGDNLVSTQQSLHAQHRKKMALSLVLAGVAGAAVFLWSKNSDA
eukprot:gene13919-15371_t